MYGVVSSIFWFFASQLIEIITLFRKLDSNILIFNSSGNVNYNFNTKTLFEFYLKNSHKRVYFIINEDDTRDHLNNVVGGYFISSKKFKDLLIIASAKVWVTSTLECPYTPFPIRNRSRMIYHIGHGVPLKRIGLAQYNISFFKKANRYIRTRVFSHVLCYSKEFTVVFKEIFKNKKITYVTLGQPRNDELSKLHNNYFSEKIKFFEFDTHILYAPTWRIDEPTKFFPFEDLSADELNRILVRENAVIFIRKHPFYPSTINQAFLSKSNIKIFDFDSFPDITEYMHMFDKLITDYSSIFLDFLCLDKPIAFIPYDLKKYAKNTGFSFPYEELTPGNKILSKNEFYNFIINSNDDYYHKREKIKNMLHLKIEGNCKENFNYINGID